MVIRLRHYAPSKSAPPMRMPDHDPLSQAEAGLAPDPNPNPSPNPNPDSAPTHDNADEDEDQDVGNSRGGLAFSADVFISSSFDVGAWVVDCRKRLPLDAILRDLERYRRALKSEMMDMINNDYADFVHLSSQLSGVDEASARLRTTLSEIHGEIVSVENAVSEAVKATETKLEERRQIAQQQENLQLALMAIDSLQRLERVLNEPTPAATASGSGSGSSSATIDTATADEAGHGCELVPVPPTFLPDAVPAETAKAKTKATVETSDTEAVPSTAGSNGGGSGGGVLKVDDDVELGRFLEHIGAEFQQLHLLVVRGAELGPVRALQDRVKALEKKIGDHLRTAFLDSVLRLTCASGNGAGDAVDTEKGPAHLLTRTLRAFGAINMISDVEQLFQREIVAGALNEIAIPAKLLVTSDADGGGGATGSTSTLHRVYSDILKTLERVVLPVIKLSQHLEGVGVSGEGEGEGETEAEAEAEVDAVSFDFSRGAFEAVSNLLINKASPIFVPGIPHVFRVNHAETMEFVASFESLLCLTVESKSRLRDSRPYTEFMRRWNRNLAVYFQLRFQECARTLEDAMGQGSGQGKPVLVSAEDDEHDPDLHMAVSRVVWSLITRCWRDKGDGGDGGDDVYFVSSIVHKFLKLTLQILARYRTWLRGGLGLGLGPSGGGESSFGLSAETGTETGTGVEIAAASWSMSTGLLAQIHHDVALMRDALPRWAVAIVHPRVHVVAGRRAIDAALDVIIAELGLIQESVEGRICSSLTADCAKLLAPVRTITATYRHTNKPSPKAHSPYVASVMRPVDSFVNAYGSLIGPDVLSGCLERVASDVSGVFRTHVSSVLAALKKTEDSIRRLGLEKGKTGADVASAAGPSSDAAKITLQLQLDVRKFGEVMGKSCRIEGVDGESGIAFAPYAALWREVKT